MPCTIRYWDNDPPQLEEGDPPLTPLMVLEDWPTKHTREGERCFVNDVWSWVMKIEDHGDSQDVYVRDVVMGQTARGKVY